jgi:hypothetical protein
VRGKESQPIGFGSHVDVVFRIESGVTNLVLLGVVFVAGRDREFVRRLQTHPAAAPHAHVAGF